MPRGPSGRFDFRAHRGFWPPAASAACGRAPQMNRIWGNVPAFNTYRRLLPRLGVRCRQAASRGLGLHTLRLVHRLYNRRGIACVGFGLSALDSIRIPRNPGAGASCCGAKGAAMVRLGAIRKLQIKTVACRRIPITRPCYLCNTLWKRGGAGPPEAVPLLRVQKSSVIVMTRRRGASRGRPVRWFA